MKFFGISLKPKWSKGLFGCAGDKCTCCITCCLPCVTFGQIAEVIDEGESSCCRQGCVYGVLMGFQLQWLLSCIYREKLRSKYGLPDEPCCDCCVHFCCDSCALCQEHAELKHRGLDPSKGWTGPPKTLSMFR
ncbi:cell number regulator 7-like [Alnus glutinosa]|uniref:cell number regulator 7-like n=1 Tax=Alnus glutinosa TaxID=3517 RepID=UPI002D7A090F|nr:cell number regulator 7-like [Alnus glutinosa]